MRNNENSRETVFQTNIIRLLVIISRGCEEKPKAGKDITLIIKLFYRIC